ncbi:hypothetical protein SAMN05660461_6443 [Chitinophaga ginsengisegetis]|uniref:Uncharacterized protein n=1 Tax=Chitinophaga ginsengisegetis TaxID=393003 RepID=A0A1T5PCY4_9BACT|nr:hypothetical protein [Chitinophaga ginsengisegetis]SKD10523.1 hypothetical protein SAMN05660461_6443 [Chitinophaga ginsengisegetis]
MSNTNDESIQRMLEEKGERAGEQALYNDPRFSVDVKLYQLLFDELKKLPEADPPPDFARNVTAALAASGKKVKAGREELVIVVSLSVIGVLLAVGMIGWIGVDTIPLASVASPGMLFISVFVLTCFLIMQSLESKLLKKKYS